MPSVLAVFAHPDDESLAAGGLLASNAAAGWPTAVVTATWAEHAARAGELAEALQILGAGAPRMLGYADARAPGSAPGRPRLLDVPLDEAVERLADHVREVRPEVLVTHDAYGGLTGHPDHAHTHRVAVAAARACGVERVLLATHPHSSLTRVRDLVGARKAAHTVPDDQVALTLDATPWLEQKIAAVLAHRTEVARGALPGLVAGFSPEDRAALLGTEWYAEERLG